MSRYAADTTVPVDRSKAEIEKLLRNHGATGFTYGWQGDRAGINFEMGGRRFRFGISLPTPGEHRFTHTPTGQERHPNLADKEYEKEVRRRWRSLVLLLKAKLVGIQEGVVTLEDELLAYLVLPDNSTVGDWAAGQIEDAYATGRMPDLLPGVRRALPAPEDES